MLRWAVDTKRMETTQALASGQSDVPVKAVALFSSGIGYFEHAGTVAGSGSTELRFKTQQINDILKSLVLEDLDGGRITTITYPSQDPIAKTLRSFQVDITENPSLGDLLNQLRGAKVKLDVAGEHVAGMILGLEMRPKAVGEVTIEVWVLNLVSGGAIRSLELESVQKIQLEEVQLQEELNKALLALAQSRDQDKKPVTINFSGEGKRRVRLGYVVETPIWKTSYRLILDKGPEVKQHLQGWAIIENQTDNDWIDVQLSLVSGRPISFIQDLYRPLYVPRPVVKPELYASLRPQTYEGGMEESPGQSGGGAAPAPATRSRRRGREMIMAASAVVAAPPAYSLAADFDPTSSIESVASAAQVGELFQYTVGSVSLPRQRSAMIPIITDPVEVERVSIYNQSVLARNPLYGARVKNTTGKHLLAGPITVLDESTYAGDASIDNVPPGQERLISYGVDLQILIDATKNTQKNRIQSGRIVKGVLTVTRKQVSTQEYAFENKGVVGKTLIIEHGVTQGWKLVDTEKPMETTEALYRFKTKVAAGKAGTFTVREEIVTSEELAILPMNDGQLEYFRMDGQIEKAVKDVLTEALAMKGTMAGTQRQIQEKNAKLQQITEEQSRLRDNIKTVAGNSTYSTRLLTKLNDQETLIEKIQGEVEQLTAVFEKQRREVEEYLAGATAG